MKYHKQLQVVNPNDKIVNGSCYPTAIACVLDLELHEVPYVNLLYFHSCGDFVKDNTLLYLKNRYLKGKEYNEATETEKENYDNAYNLTYRLWDEVMELFLASRGYYLDYIPDVERFIKDNPDTPYFVTGKSLRGTSHIVIYMNGKPHHDPHPLDTFLVEESETNKYIYQALFPIQDYLNSGKYYDKY